MSQDTVSTVSGEIQTITSLAQFSFELLHYQESKGQFELIYYA